MPFARVAIVGATGAVGQEFARVLAQREFPAEEYRLLASPASAGTTVNWCGKRRVVEALSADSFAGVNLAFFSAGAARSREFAPFARAAGAVVIDNSSAFRLQADVPLVVPEINAGALAEHQGLIANPNCSTIILALTLWPLHRHAPIRRVVVATYQAVSGAGARALAELEAQTRAALAAPTFSETPVSGRAPVFHEPAAFNVFSHDSPVGPDGYNVEERKLVDETRRIFADPSIAIAPTCLRVPVRRAHTEAISVEFAEPVPAAVARDLLAAAPGLRVRDEPAENDFPTPLKATDRDEILVGRIRQDPSIPDQRGLQLLCAGDQLRKGAALNAVQIAERLL